MNQDLAALLRSARVAKGWSQAELARRCGLDRAHLARLESGQRGASMETLARLVEVLELDPRAVFAPAAAPEGPMLAAEPSEPVYGSTADPAVARLMALRGFASPEEAVKAAVDEALERAVAERRRSWRSLLGAAVGEGENPNPRFADDDAAWREE
jgi:transcriptional regulator with XRE-family HTH domain